MPRVDKDRRREELRRRTERSYDTRDSTGQTIFKRSDLPLWKCGNGEHEIDIIPYIAGNSDPDSKIKAGMWTYVLDIKVHYSVGVNNSAFVCLRTFNEKCPICEYRDELMEEEDYDEDYAKRLRAKRRNIYNVVVLDEGKEEKKGVQIFDASQWLMERLLTPLTKTRKGRSGAPIGGFDTYSAIEDGCSVSFVREGQQENTRFIGHALIPRDYDLDQE